MPSYWHAFSSGEPVPRWAHEFLSSFPWNALRLEAFLMSTGVVVQPSEITPAVVPSTAADTCEQSFREDHEEEVLTEPDMELDVDVVDVAIEKDCHQYMVSRDDTPSPERSVPTAAAAQPSNAQSSSSRSMTVSERLRPIAAKSAARRVFKHGECPHHHTALQPHVWSARSAKRGQPALVCSRFFKRGEDGKPLCWFYKKVSFAQAAQWPRYHRMRFQSLQNRFLRAGHGE